VDVRDLRKRATAHVAELGPEPVDPHDAATWDAERYDAAALLAALAGL
jgi:hypothetical protein